MDKVNQHIQNQLKQHSEKNIFCSSDISKLEFIQSTSAILSNYKLSKIDKNTEQDLLTFTVKNTLEKFYQTNQFYSFDEKSIQALREIYSNLFSEIVKESEDKNTIDLNIIYTKQYKNLKKWIRKTNSFAEKTYKNQSADLDEDVVCSEYSAQAQLELLGMDPQKLLEPIIDIGCGENANLVSYLRNLGYDVLGIDRSVENSSFSLNVNWFEYNFIPNNWGTVLSNLGFSNHFNHHHLRNNGTYINYAKKYIEILNSLKIGGTFYYAPEVLFIEKYLNQNQFKVQYQSIHNTQFKSVQIKRLK